jgi:sirohydrochlorin cobaltochelatase
MSTGIILFAHGSRDPLWRAPVEAVAERIRTHRPGIPVACAYLELCEPNLATAAMHLIAAGALSIRTLPLFLGVGKHAREDLPVLMADLRAAHPGVAFSLLPAVGEHPALLDLMADIAVANLIPEAP